MSELLENMNFNQYANFVTRLGSKYSTGNFMSRVGTTGLGIAGEIGEVADITESIISDNALSEDNRIRLIDECGDIMWYVVFGCKNFLEFELPDFSSMPFEKRSVLYPVTSIKNLYFKLACSCGKACDTMKKLLFHGIPFDEGVRNKLVMSMQKINQTISIIGADVCNVSLQTIINKNVEKLSDRYKSLEFSTEEFLAKENAKEE